MAYLISYLLMEPVKRVASALLYPVAYACSTPIRKRSRLTPVMWEDYLCRPNWWGVPLWLFLDDSAFLEFGKEYADKPKYYPAWVWGLGSDFLKAYWWAAIRNSCVNWNNWCAFNMGTMLSETGKKDNKNFYIIRTFTSGCRRPYCEFYLFGKWNQVGWIKKGRFEIDILKRII